MARRLVNLCLHWESDVAASSQFDRTWTITPRQMNVKRFKLLGWKIDRIETAGEGSDGSGIEVYFGKNQDGKGPWLDAVQFGERFLGGGGLVYTGGGKVMPVENCFTYPEPIPFDADDSLYIFTTWINKGGSAARYELHLTIFLEVED